MTEKSWLWTTGTSGDGASTYTQIDTSEFMKVVAACHAFEGVAPDYLNNLAGTASTNTCTINTGGAIVDGKPYKNDASKPLTIPSSVTYNRIDRVVLRANWSTYTVRLTVISGTEAPSPTAPAITQTSGTTYDILLYQALVTPAGSVSLTDERAFARVQTTGIAPAAITSALLASGAVLAANLDSAVRFQRLGQIVGNGTGIVSLASIPATFSHLLLICNVRSTRATSGSDNLLLRFNDDAGANYNDRSIQNLSSSITTGSDSAQTQMSPGVAETNAAGSTALALSLILIPNYTSTTASKQVLSLAGGAVGDVIAINISRWSSTAAINKISAFTYSAATPYYLTTDSVITVYGIP